MKQLLRLFYNNQSKIYKGLLFTFITLFIVYLIPVENQFSYDFSKGDTWGYESLYAPFDFAIIKSQSEIEEMISVPPTSIKVAISPTVMNSVTFNTLLSASCCANSSSVF